MICWRIFLLPFSYLGCWFNFQLSSFAFDILSWNQSGQERRVKLRGSVLWRSRVIWLSQTLLLFQVVFWRRYFFRREAGALKPKLLDFLLLIREKALKKFADLQSTRIMNLIYQKSQFSSTLSVDGCAHCAPSCPLPFWCFLLVITSQNVSQPWNVDWPWKKGKSR